MKELLTASRMSTLVGCPRRHFWQYEIGLKTVTVATALRIGTAWHSAMEARWKGSSYEHALLAALQGEFDEFQAATLSGLLAGYYRRYDQEPIIALNPEIEFRHPIMGSRTFDSAGKIDGLGTLADGRTVLLEHKTTADSIESNSDYWLRLRLNQQVMQYLCAARELGHDVQTIIYDVCRKPSIRQKQTETAEEFGARLAADTLARPEFYFARREVPVLDQDLEEFKVQRYELSKLILTLRQAENRTALREQAWPRNLSDFGCRMCPFSSFCLQSIHADAEHVPSGFVLKEVNAELSAQKKGE